MLVRPRPFLKSVTSGARLINQLRSTRKQTRKQQTKTKNHSEKTTAFAAAYLVPVTCMYEYQPGYRATRSVGMYVLAPRSRFDSDIIPRTLSHVPRVPRAGRCFIGKSPIFFQKLNLSPSGSRLGSYRCLIMSTPSSFDFTHRHFSIVDLNYLV